jgi:putative SOS response-associated peptidase YedK
MCGRFDLHSSIEIIARVFQIDSIIFDVKPNYNVAPSQDIAIVINDGKNRLVPCKWGFVPNWSKEIKTGYKMINARAETVATNRSFQSAFENQRCLIVADGFYHWQKLSGTKKPFYVRLKSLKPMGLAGLYNNWTSPEGEEICTCTIIITDANELLAPIHPRMPVILPENAYGLWLDPSMHDQDRLMLLLKPFPSEEMEHYPVTSKVNSYKYNDPENIRPLVMKSEEKKPKKNRTAA